MLEYIRILSIISEIKIYFDYKYLLKYLIT
jgi:hypothetical protein